jgi:hypothetical protein
VSNLCRSVVVWVLCRQARGVMERNVMNVLCCCCGLLRPFTDPCCYCFAMFCVWLDLHADSACLLGRDGYWWSIGTYLRRLHENLTWESGVGTSQLLTKMCFCVLLDLQGAVTLTRPAWMGLMNANGVLVRTYDVLRKLNLGRVVWEHRKC